MVMWASESVFDTSYASAQSAGSGTTASPACGGPPTKGIRVVVVKYPFDDLVPC